MGAISTAPIRENPSKITPFIYSKKMHLFRKKTKGIFGLDDEVNRRKQR